MKKVLSSLLILTFVLLFLSACGDAPADTEKSESTHESTSEKQEAATDSLPESESEKESTSETEPEKAGYTLENEVIVDDDNCRFEIIGVDADSIWGFTLKAYCENKTSDGSMTFAMRDVSINGYMVDPFWAEEVAAGKKSNADILMCSDLKDVCGMETAEEIQFTLAVYSSEDWNKQYVGETFTIYPTGLSAEEISYPERKTEADEMIVADNEKVTFVILGSENDAIWGYTLKCFIANKTDMNVTMGLQDVSVNGFMVDPFWAVSIAPGKMTYTEISFSSTEFDDNNITEVEEIEFTAHLYDNENLFDGDIWKETKTYYPV